MATLSSSEDEDEDDDGDDAEPDADEEELPLTSPSSRRLSFTCFAARFPLGGFSSSLELLLLELLLLEELRSSRSRLTLGRCLEPDGTFFFDGSGRLLAGVFLED